MGAPDVMSAQDTPAASPMSDAAGVLSVRWGCSSTSLSPSSLHDLEVFARRSPLEPILFRSSELIPDFPLSTRLRWRQTYLHNVVETNTLARSAAQVVAACGDNPVILLKGLALRLVAYQDPGLRPMVDSDLLIRGEQRHAVIEALAVVSYTSPPRPRTSWGRIEFENAIFVSKRGDIASATELHWHLFDSPHHQHCIDMEWFWSTARPVHFEGVDALVLGPEAQLLHLCGHLALHHPVPPGGDLKPVLLWLVDIGEVLHRYRDELDWDVVLAKAAEFDLVLPLQEVLGHVRSLWPFFFPDELWARIAALRPTRTEARVYRWLTAEHRPTLYRFVTDLAMMPTWSMRVRYAAQSIFPPAEYMRDRYRIRRGWMVPLYYPYRWYVGLVGLWRRRR